MERFTKSLTRGSRGGCQSCLDPAEQAHVGTRGRRGAPLSEEELLSLLRRRWQASYDLQLVRRQGRLYLHVMWGHLEQQSFPLSVEAYSEKLAAIVASLNGLGVAPQVRDWLTTTRDKPRLGKALSLPLQLPAGRSSEFLL